MRVLRVLLSQLLRVPGGRAKCYSCGIMGHYAVVCGSKGGTKGKIQEIAQEGQGSGEEFLGTLTTDKKNY